MATCTVIKSGETITSEPSERVEKLESLIDSIQMPIAHPYVGDAVLYDSETDKIITVNADELTAEAYPASRYTPIGVVAIPIQHNVYGDNKCGVVSLKYMNYSTPDEGSTGTQSMYWGNNSSLLTPLARNYVPIIGTGNSQSREVTNIANNAYLPSDNFSAVACVQDREAFYNSGTNNAVPSPYLAGANFNPNYSQTEEPSNEANALADFDGVGNTQLILDNVTVEDWKTASTISNSSSSGNYPAACCCWRFHTAGTNQGDWYLPAMGELGYVMVRLKTINTTISNIISIYGSSAAGAISTSSSYYHWASTESSSSHARDVGTSNGYVGNDGKHGSSVVRAFARL